MVASLTHPHDPFAIPSKYWDLYRDGEIDGPRVTLKPEDLDPHSKRLRHVCDMDAVTITAEQARAARHAYFGAISYVDDNLGRLVAALEATGLRDDTIIVFTSDHGEMLGERGMWYKMSWFEGSARVPLIISAPGRYQRNRIASSVSLVDLLPTLVEMAGGEAAGLADHGIDGRSLVPHLTGIGGHDEAIGEYLAEGAIAPVVMLRRGRWKFIHSPADPDQLFDLSVDPAELRNLADDPGCSKVRQAFLDEVTRRWDLADMDRAVRDSQRRRRLVDAALTTGKVTSWDYQPVHDASRQYMRNTVDLDDLEAMARYPRVRE
jgi:choline-sulfatase